MTDARPDDAVPDGTVADDAVPDGTAPDGTALARGALDWLLTVARQSGTALSWATTPDDDEPHPTLYSGTAGIVLALLEGYRHFGDGLGSPWRPCGAPARSRRRWTGSGSSRPCTRGWPEWLSRCMPSARCWETPPPAWLRIAPWTGSRRFDGTRWGPQFELLGGNAGIALGAPATGDIELACWR